LVNGGGCVRQGSTERGWKVYYRKKLKNKVVRLMLEKSYIIQGVGGREKKIVVNRECTV